MFFFFSVLYFSGGRGCEVLFMLIIAEYNRTINYIVKMSFHIYSIIIYNIYNIKYYIRSRSKHKRYDDDDDDQCKRGLVRITSSQHGHEVMNCLE